MPDAFEPAVLAAGFGHALHEAGVPGTPERAVRFARALDISPPTTRDELYWTARVIYVSSREELAAFDAVFAGVFDGLRDVADARGDPNAPPPVGGEPGRPRSPGPGPEEVLAHARLAPVPVPGLGAGGGGRRPERAGRACGCECRGAAA